MLRESNKRIIHAIDIIDEILKTTEFGLGNINFEVKPSIVSKCTTVAQLSTVFLALLNPKLPDFYMIQWSLYWLTAGLTIISGLHYIYIGLNILQDASGNSQAQK